ncbi:MAG: cytidylate kinase-like family protein [Lachnospiraceae bacterium]|nr:cytidylate kinase-like family protein [Lachnospiraceae bacterium]
MAKNMIYTIGRQYGSGGKEIGMKLAEKLGIKCYDRELLERASKESGLCQELFENHDEKPTNSFLYSLVMDTYSMGYSSSPYMDIPINHKVFLAQFDTIKKLASEGPCVIVGRCADYALEEFDNCVNAFILADLETRAKRISKLYNMSLSKATDTVVKTDKRRASYYNYYSNKKWGDVHSYHICIDSTQVGTDGAVDILIQFGELKAKNRQ